MQHDCMTEVQRGQRWFDLCCALPGLRYLRGEHDRQYELAPCLTNVLAAVVRLLGAPEALADNWANFASWWSIGRPELRVCQRAHDPHTILFVLAGVDEQLEVRMVPRSLHAYTRRLNAQRSHRESAGSLFLPLWQHNALPDELHPLLPLVSAADSPFRATDLPPHSLLSIKAFVRFRERTHRPLKAHLIWAGLQSLVEWQYGRDDEALQILQCALRTADVNGRWELVSWLLAEVQMRPVPPSSEKRMAELLLPHLKGLQLNTQAWHEVLAMPTLACMLALMGAERSVLANLRARRGSWQWLSILPQLASCAYGMNQAGLFMRFAIGVSFHMSRRH
jgi:hypothetical protein